jgi:predicted permease
MFGVRRRDAALEEEVDAIVRIATDDYVRRGVSPHQAREAALRALGPIAAMKDAYRDQRGLPAIEALVQDVRIAARGIRRAPGLSLLVVVTMTVAIGANTALFGVLDTVLLRPLPFAASERLVWIAERNASGAVLVGSDLDRWRRVSRSFESLEAVTSADVTLSGNDARRVRAIGISGPIRRLFGLAPVLGRDFVDEDFARISDRTFGIPTDGARGRPVLISDRLFRSRFGGDPAVLGRSLLVGRVAYTVVGVAPADMRLPVGPLVRRGLGAPSDPDLVVPIAPAAGAAAIGRLKPGVTPEAARTELAAIRSATPAPPSMQSTARPELRVVPLQDRLVGDVRGTLLLLAGACLLVLLIASVNVAGLVTSRGAARRRELAVRLALGAGRTRIARLVLTEVLLLTAAGTVAGLALAWALVGSLRAHPELAIPRLTHVAIDARVAAAAVVLCVVAALASGLLPLLFDASIPAVAVLADGGRQTSRSRRRAQRLLVVAQVAVAVTLLTGAGLMMRSLAHAHAHGAPLNGEDVLSARLEPYDAGLTATPADRRRLLAALVARIESMPQVTAAAVWSVPYLWSIAVDGIGPPASSLPPTALWVAVSPHFGAASGVPLIAGRWFLDEEADRSSVVVSDAFVRRLGPGVRDPGALLGRHVQGPPAVGRLPWTIVGVVRDFRTGVGDGAPPDDDARLFPQVFFLHDGGPSAAVDLLVRSTAGDPLALVPALHAAIRHVGAVSLLEPRTLDDQIDAAMAPRRLETATFVAFAMVAVFLAAIGIGGLLAYGVATQTREIGVRVAVGADVRDVLRLVTAEGVWLMTWGLACGLAGAAGLARAMSTLLYRVHPFDPSEYAAAAVVLAVAAVAGAAVPAARAARIQPVEAMRYE